MAKILLRLRLVPEDEAEEVRQLLDDHGIHWFETTAGRFGMSFPAIWLKDDDDWDIAAKLLNNYQQHRREKAFADRARQIEAGDVDTFLSRLLSHPLQIAIILVAVAVIAYFSVVPFFSLLGA